MTLQGKNWKHVLQIPHLMERGGGEGGREGINYKHSFSIRLEREGGSERASEERSAHALIFADDVCKTTVR